uniref:Uncharacterized protein n=1 Tax=Bursaphelenchus xylophilus TaxID=6326 RepID=A0A1I7RQL8_BURXY
MHWTPAATSEYGAQQLNWSDLDWTEPIYSLDHPTKTPAPKSARCEPALAHARCAWGFERRGSLYSENTEQPSSSSRPFPQPQFNEPPHSFPAPHLQHAVETPNYQEFASFSSERRGPRRQYSSDTDYFQLIDDLINEDRQVGESISDLKSEGDPILASQPTSTSSQPEHQPERPPFLRPSQTSMKPSTSSTSVPKTSTQQLEPGSSGTAVVTSSAMKLEAESSNAFKLLMNQQHVAGNPYNSLLSG